MDQTPGVDMLYLIHRVGSHGFKTGFVACLGIACGCLIHILFAASSFAFMVIRYYLIYLGLTMLSRYSEHSTLPIAGVSVELMDVFNQGVLINVLNPKIALFFLAFIPQFMETGSTQKPLAFIILGLIFNLNSTLIITTVSWLTVRVKNNFRLIESQGRTINKILGVGFIALGSRLAIDR